VKPYTVRDGTLHDEQDGTAHTMAIFRMPDPVRVSGPSSATPKLKIVGNMIELKNPTARIVHIAICPPTSMETVTSCQFRATDEPAE